MECLSRPARIDPRPIRFASSGKIGTLGPGNCPTGKKPLRLLTNQSDYNAMNTKSIIAAVALATLVGGAGAFAQAPDTQNTTPAPNQVVYLPQLPGAADLVKAAPGQGVSIAQITQTSDQVTVVYKLANGQTNTVAYRLISAVEPSNGAPAPAPATAVVYAQPAPVYPGYYAPDYYWPWYGPVRLDLGFGWGWRGGGWRGGGWGGHGGWGGRSGGWGGHGR